MMIKKVGVVLVAIFGNQLNAVSLDGTVAVQYQAANYVFANGDFARGFVRLNGGFTVPAAATVSLNLVVPTAGPINLNDTGVVFLEGDLPLQSDVTLSAGGIIDGQGYSVLMNGNLRVPSGKTLEFTSDTIIDGQGNSLILQNGTPGGQLFINGAPGTRLTLRNMTVRGLKFYADGTPAIRFGTNPDQSLTLENVNFILSDDFLFIGGKLEIKNVVKVSGKFLPEFRPTLEPTLFVYLSSDDCIIREDATLFIDSTIGWIYFPLDLNNKHMVMRRPSSQLFLNGAALFVPQEVGLLLTKGHILVDHKTFLQSNGVLDTSKPIQFGDGQKSQDVALNMFPGASLELADAFIRYKNKE